VVGSVCGIFKLCFYRHSVRGYRPYVLRPRIPYLLAHQPPTDTFLDQPQRFVAPEYLHIIAQCLALPRIARRRKTEITGVLLVFGIPAISYFSRPPIPIFRTR